MKTRFLLQPLLALALIVPLVARDGLPGGGGPDVPGGPLPYPAGTRTGLASLDNVLAALDAPNPGPLEKLFQPAPAPCVVNPQGLTSPPLCPDGVTAGTLIPVFRATTCEAVWPDELEQVLTSLWKRARPVLAIYREPTDTNWLPAADFAVVFQGQRTGSEWPAVVRIKDGRVNGLAFGCGQPLEQVIAGVTEERFVLPPLHAVPGPSAAPPAPASARAQVIVCVRAPCPGYTVEWTDSSSDESGFLVYWRAVCPGATAGPGVIAAAPPNTTRREMLAIPFRDGCKNEVGVAAYNAAGVSAITWAPQAL